jgi:cytochrome b6-f complex iron-sulfur subunit
MDRRRFILASLCGSLPLVVGACAGFRYVSYTREGSLLVVKRADMEGSRFALLENPQIPRAIYLHRLDDGTFSAVLTRCMHLGCQVEPAGDRLACPCHGSEYSVTGEVLQGPAERSLYRYTVTADAQNIYIELPDPSIL